MILVSATLSKAVASMKNHDAAFISAEIGDRVQTPQFQRGPEHEKRYQEKAMQKLSMDLRSLGYSFTAVKGGWSENSGKFHPEDSFYVVDLDDTGKLKTDMSELAQKYYQDAFLFIPAGSEDGQMVGTASYKSWGKYGWDKEGATAYHKGWTSEGRTLGKKRQFDTRFRGRPMGFGGEGSNTVLSQSFLVEDLKARLDFD